MCPAGVETLLRRHLWAVELIVLGTTAVLAAHATAHLADAWLLRLGGEPAPAVLAAPAPLASSTPDPVDEIVRRNIFCSACRAQSPRQVRAQAGPQDGRFPQPLPLRLLAIMFAGPPADPRRSVAVIKDQRGATGAFAIGASLGAPTGAVVDAIDETDVWLRLPDGRRQALTLLDGAAAVPGPTAPAPSDPLVAELDAGLEQRGENRYGVRRATIESLLGKMDTVPPQARVEPDLRDGQPIGFRLRDVKDDGVFARIGLRDGDVISSVNGLATSGGDNALAIYASLRSAGHLSVGIERAGRRITTEYDIE